MEALAQRPKQLGVHRIRIASTAVIAALGAAAVLLVGCSSTGEPDYCQQSFWERQATLPVDPYGIGPGLLINALMGLACDGKGSARPALQQASTQEPGVSTSTIQAANNGDQAAQFTLALAYFEEEEPVAALWACRAASQGEGGAAYMLSIVTSRGLFGAQPDQDEAYVWFRRSVLADYISPERHFPNEPLLQFDNLSAEKKAQLNEQASGPWIGSATSTRRRNLQP